MNPSEVVTHLRRVAAAIQNSKNPDRNLVAKDLCKILSSMNSIIVIHKYADGAFIDVTTTDQVMPSLGGYAKLLLPEGDEVSFAKTIDDIKKNEDMDDQNLLEALYGAGILNPKTERLR